jgi:hypothetical protein
MAEKKDVGDLQNVKIARTFLLSVPVINEMRKRKREEKIGDFSAFVESLIRKEFGMK